MSLPPRVLFTLLEIAARWGCSKGDVAAWAATEKLELVTAVSPRRFGDGQVAGLTAIPAADILSMFRRCGTGPTECEVRRLRKLGSKEWVFAPPEEPGVMVAKADIVILADEVSRFEDKHGMFRRRSGGGIEQRYDWDGFYKAMILRLHFEGVPEQLGDLVGEMQEWFIDNTADGVVPEESTIRKRISPIWRALRAGP